MSPRPADFQWLTTAPNPRNTHGGYDAGRKSWRLHAVPAKAAESVSDVRSRRAACGVKPRHGYDIDLFIEKKCARCLVALGIACSVCRGRGRSPAAVTGSCDGCLGGCTAEAQARLTKLRTAGDDP